MLVYFILLVYWFLIEIYFSRYCKKYRNLDSKKLKSIFMGTGLIVVMGLRHFSVGCDTVQYLYRYNNVIYTLNNEIFSNPEWGFHGLATLLKKIGLSNQGYILVMSFLIALPFSLLVYKYSRNIFLSFFLHLTIGVFTMNMSGIRQSLAMSIIMIAFMFGTKRNLLGFFISVGLAYTVHNTAICFLPVYFLFNITVSHKRGIILLLATAMTIILRIPIAYLMGYFLPSKYENYDLISEAYPVNPLLIIISFAIPLACLFYWKNIEKQKIHDFKINSILYIMSCLYAFGNVLALNSSLLGRLSFYFLTFNAILIPNVISSIKNRETRLFAMVLCIILPLIQFIMSTPGGTLQIDKYIFFWQGV